ncbi:hypothetical protein HYQ27_gp088 [Salmonella phage Se-J]|uniref:hypothetical protein n=1 Tax=Salmonella phage Se-J TaxID=2698910 RepID=UPI0018AF6088|nr:hypothetical protein HYQ27_gp088 [Salmonella phage Se-J]
MWQSGRMQETVNLPVTARWFKSIHSHQICDHRGNPRREWRPGRKTGIWAPTAKVLYLLELGGLNGRESEPSVVGSTPTHPTPDEMGSSSQIKL